MTKNKTVQPTVASAVADDSNVVTIGGKAGSASVPDALASEREKNAKRLAMKADYNKRVNSLLARAADIVSTVGVATSEAAKLEDEAAVLLYQGRVAGAYNADEVSSLLGDRFGWVPKKDGTPGKTPMGEGQAIRKRVVRLVQATEYAAGDEPARFFAGLPVEDVSDVVNGVANGTVTIWTAYDKLTDLKRDHSSRTEAAFDPKRIAAIVQALSESGAPAMLAESGALRAAYAALQDAIAMVGEAAGRLMADKAA